MTPMTAPADPSTRRSARPHQRAAGFVAGAVMVLLVTASTLLLGPAAARAQEAGDDPVTWGIRPSTATGPDGRNAFEYSLGPGATVEDYVGVSNFTDRPLELDVYATDAFTSPDGHFDLLPAAERPADVGGWVAFAEQTVTVPPRSRLDIPFRLTVPERATPGDHPGGIVASLRTTTSDEDGNPFTVDRRVGARIYLQVEGALAPAATIENLAVRYEGSANPAGPGDATVTYMVTNTGNARIAGEPIIEIAGPFGLGRREARGPEITELLPGDSLTFTVPVTSVAPFVRLDTSVRLTPVPVAGGSFADVDHAGADATTWAVPWGQLAAVVALVLVTWAWRTHRRRRLRALATQLDAARAAGHAEAIDPSRSPAPQCR